MSEMPGRSERSGAINHLNSIVDAWEALPGGKRVKNSDVERWLSEDMSPAINSIREFLSRPLPEVLREETHDDLS